MSQAVIFSVSDFVAVFNQTISYAYPSVAIEGELANFRVSKNRWVYFDLKDEQSSVKFFGSTYSLGSPLEDGMKLRVTGTPQLHNQFGFSITVRSIELSGEGTIKKAAKLLEARLEKEGLFDSSRRRPLLYPPQRIGLIASDESAAYSDFIKVLNARWGRVEIEHYHVQVQGEAAPAQLVAAIEFFNTHAENIDVLVITRGGGSADDLQSFSDERVVRAVAGSRVPTLVAVGHERDESLAERAADLRASTPSNAAELLVPDRRHEQQLLGDTKLQLTQSLWRAHEQARSSLEQDRHELLTVIERLLGDEQDYLSTQRKILGLASPQAIVKKGYAIVRQNNKVVSSAASASSVINVELRDGELDARVVGKRIMKRGKRYG